MLIHLFGPPAQLELYSGRKITVRPSWIRWCVDGCTTSLYSFHTLMIVLVVPRYMRFSLRGEVVWDGEGSQTTVRNVHRACTCWNACTTNAPHQIPDPILVMAVGFARKTCKIEGLRTNTYISYTLTVCIGMKMSPYGMWRFFSQEEFRTH